MALYEDVIDLDRLSVFKTEADDEYQSKLISGTNIKTINGEPLLGSGDLMVRSSGSSVFYGTCATAAATAAKDVVCDEFASDNLVEGTVLIVKFTYAQTYNGAPTLNVQSTGAKNIKRVGTTNAARYEWVAGEVLQFVYDGSYWVLTDAGLATTTYYGVTKLATSATSTNTATALTPGSLNNFAQNMVSGYPVFSTASTYEVGDRVRYGYFTYECVNAITTAGAWDAADWTALDSLQEQVDAKQDVLVSGTSIKTVNDTSLLGSGNISLPTASDIPTKTSDLTNDSGFVTDAGVTSFNGSTGAVTYTAPVTSVNGSTGAVTVAVPSAATATPNMDGTAAVGSSAKYAKEDHVHPTDTSRAAASHTHGNITSDGDITATAPTIASGDKLIINDESASKVTNGPAFNTLDTSSFLRHDGTWEKPSLIVADSYSSGNYSNQALLQCIADASGSGIYGHVYWLVSNTGDFLYDRGVSFDRDGLRVDGNPVATMQTTTATLPTSGWSSDSITVNVAGVTASNNVIVAPAPASVEAYAAAGIVCTAQGAGTLTFTRTSANSSAITANVLILG